MSWPRHLYSDSTLTRLLPEQKPSAGVSTNSNHTDRKQGVRGMSSSGKAEAFDEAFNDVHRTHSFSSEPFHRFVVHGNVNAAAAAADGRPAADAVAVAVQSVDSEARFTGGVDANSDPEVAAFAMKEGGELGLFPRSKHCEINCGNYYNIITGITIL